MAHEFKRSDRVSQLLQRKLAMLIKEEVKDPRLPGLITISSAEVSKDLGHAKIFFTVFTLLLKFVESCLVEAFVNANELFFNKFWDGLGYPIYFKVKNFFLLRNKLNSY